MPDRKPKSSQQPPDQGQARRDVLKKAVYVAPVIVTLGLAGHSRRAMAQRQLPSDPEPPNSTQNDDPLLDDLEQAEQRKRD